MGLGVLYRRHQRGRIGCVIQTSSNRRDWGCYTDFIKQTGLGVLYWRHQTCGLLVKVCVSNHFFSFQIIKMKLASPCSNKEQPCMTHFCEAPPRGSRVMPLFSDIIIYRKFVSQVFSVYIKPNFLPQSWDHAGLLTLMLDYMCLFTLQTYRLYMKCHHQYLFVV